MSEDEKLEIKALLSAFIVFTLTVGGCVTHERQMQAKVAIELEDPIGAKCMFAPDSAICGAYMRGVDLGTKR